MTSNKNIINAIRKVFNGILTIGREIKARRFLFIWSAICVGISIFFGISHSMVLYSNNYVTNMNIFVFTRLLEAIFLFIKLFVPMFMLTMAMKYIFDGNNEKSSETFKIAFFASIVFGLLLGTIYYLDAVHIIGNNSNALCAADVCGFSWSILWYATKAFIAVTIASLSMILGLRGIYKELSFMFSKV